MTLDEAIKHCYGVAESNCTDCGAEHLQLADWLTELKTLRAEKEKLSEKIPTIEVEPIQHGKWVRVRDAGVITIWKCSECGSTITHGVIHPTRHYKFCYNCGCKIGGGIRTMRPIDACEVHAEIQRMICSDKYNKSVDALTDVLKVLYDAPTIDVSRPAKWRLVKKYKRNWINPAFVVRNAKYKVPKLLVDHADYKCSNCGHIISRPLDMVDSYCGGCGCKMEVVDETD